MKKWGNFRYRLTKSKAQPIPLSFSGFCCKKKTTLLNGFDVVFMFSVGSFFILFVVAVVVDGVTLITRHLYVIELKDLPTWNSPVCLTPGYNNADVLFN